MSNLMLYPYITQILFTTENDGAACNCYKRSLIIALFAGVWINLRFGSRPILTICTSHVYVFNSSLMISFYKNGQKTPSF